MTTVFGVVDDTTTTKFVNRACAVHGISLPVVVDKVVVVVLKFPNSSSETSKKCSIDCTAIFLSQPKQLNLVPRSSQLTVHYLQLCCTFDVID